MHSQPILWNDVMPIYRTVAVVDLVGYSTLARMLEENTGAAAVAELNRRIQDLIQEALRPLDCALYTLMAKTGDGALILFEDPACAHHFAVGLHRCAAQHNAARSENSARRFFRIGLASGEITVTGPASDRPEYAGITIANAVRLEAAAKPGEVLVDTVTFNRLPFPLQQSYSAEFMVRGKRDETFLVRKWRMDAPAPPVGGAGMLSRRKVLALGLGATAAAGAGLWKFGNPRLFYRLHPLPAHRFVAVAAWPEPAREVAAVTREMLSSVRQALQRLESLDHGFLVVDTDEPPANDLPAESLPPLESAQKFGANLALLAASQVADGKLQLSLKVMDTKTQEVFRRTKLSGKLGNLSVLRESAVAAVAAMLDLPERVAPLEDEQEIARMPARAYQLFAEGKTLGSDFNGPRRMEGIEKLQELVNTYPELSVGYGALANAYIEQFRTSRDPAILELAKTNARHALKLNPDSSVGLLASAKVDTASGKVDTALASLGKILAKDPHDPEALLYRAAVYREKHDPAGEMHALHQILDSRPNYWRAYNDLGRLQEEQNQRDQAIESFTMATRVAPHVSLPLANLGSLYLQEKKPELAKDAFEKSIAIFPTGNAYEGLGTVAFEGKDYRRAIVAYQKAARLEPRFHGLYRDIGDCQTLLGDLDASRESFRKAAELLSADLSENPLSGSNWMLLSFYHAKVGAVAEAELDMARAEKNGGTDLDSLLSKAQTVAVLGRSEEALHLVLQCLEKGIAVADIQLAVDLREIVQDPRFINFERERSSLLNATSIYSGK